MGVMRAGRDQPAERTRNISKEMNEVATPALSRYQMFYSILYVESRAFFRECVSKALSSSYDDAGIVSCATVRECCRAGIEPGAVAFILYSVGHARSEFADLDDELAQLSEAFPAVPVILLSDVDTADHVLGAIKKGVRGFIQTSLTLDLVVEATHVVQAGGSFVPDKIVGALRSASADVAEGTRRRDDFTPRQVAVLKRLRQGKANRVIAHELEMSESRVKAHLRNLMQKLGATNRTQLVYLTKELFNNDKLV